MFPDFAECGPLARGPSHATIPPVHAHIFFSMFMDSRPLYYMMFVISMITLYSTFEKEATFCS